MSEAPSDPNVLSRRIVTKIEKNATELPPAKSGKLRGIRSDDLKRLLEDSLRPERDKFRAEEERYQARLKELERELELVRSQSAETRRRELPRLAQLVEAERSRVESLQGELQATQQRLRSQEEELAESQRVRRNTERHSAKLVRELNELRELSQNHDSSTQAEELLLALDARIAELEHQLRQRRDEFEATQQIDLHERNTRLAEQAARVRELEDSVWEALEGATPSGQARRRVREERRAALEDPEQARVLLLREIVRRQQDQEQTLEDVQLTLQNYEARLMSLEHRQRSTPGESGLRSRLEHLEGRTTEDDAWLEHLERRLQELEAQQPADGRSREVARRTDEALANLEAIVAGARGENPASVPPPRSFAAGAGPPGPTRAHGPTSRIFPAPTSEAPTRPYPSAGERTFPAPPPRTFGAEPPRVPPPSGAYALPGQADALARAPESELAALENTSVLARSLAESIRKQDEIKELLREALYQDSPELALAAGDPLVDGGYSADVQPPFAEVRARAIRACEQGIDLLRERGSPEQAQGIRELLAWLHSTPEHGPD